MFYAVAAGQCAPRKRRVSFRQCGPARTPDRDCFARACDCRRGAVLRSRETALRTAGNDGGSVKYVLGHILMEPGPHRVTFQAIAQAVQVSRVAAVSYCHNWQFRYSPARRILPGKNEYWETVE